LGKISPNFNLKKYDFNPMQRKFFMEKKNVPKFARFLKEKEKSKL
jgi:hypothetical protein